MKILYQSHKMMYKRRKLERLIPRGILRHQLYGYSLNRFYLKQYVSLKSVIIFLTRKTS